MVHAQLERSVDVFARCGALLEAHNGLREGVSTTLAFNTIQADLVDEWHEQCIRDEAWDIFRDSDGLPAVDGE